MSKYSHRFQCFVAKLFTSVPVPLPFQVKLALEIDAFVRRERSIAAKKESVVNVTTLAELLKRSLGDVEGDRVVKDMTQANCERTARVVANALGVKLRSRP
jgi:hypothetical protein